MRGDVTLHLVFAGPPDPVKHLELTPVLEGQTGIDKIYLSKKNVQDIIKKMLYKYKIGQKYEVFPGYWVEKKNFMQLVEEKLNVGRTVYVLDPDGQDIRTADIKENPVFILGDHRGLPDKEYKRLKKIATPVSIGNKEYFASHTIAIVNNELDRRGI